MLALELCLDLVCDLEKYFTVIQIDSLYQAAIFCRGKTKNENSESSHVDWKREKIFHSSLIPHLENVKNHS